MRVQIIFSSFLNISAVTLSKLSSPKNDFDSGFLRDDKLSNLDFLFFIVAYCMLK